MTVQYLTMGQVLKLHRLVMEQSSAHGIVRDLPLLEAAVAQPRMTFDGRDLYPTLLEKVAALGFSLIRNHPFVDGNKRVGHAAMEVMLGLNGFSLVAHIDEAERTILGVASGEFGREVLLGFLQRNANLAT